MHINACTQFFSNMTCIALKVNTVFDQCMHSLRIEPMTDLDALLLNVNMWSVCEHKRSVSDTVLSCSLSGSLSLCICIAVLRASGHIGAVRCHCCSGELITPCCPRPFLIRHVQGFRRRYGWVRERDSFAPEFLTQTVGLLHLMAFDKETD